MNLKTIITVAALATCGFASASQASVVFFSTSSTTPTLTDAQNIVLNANPGQTITGSLFAWVALNPTTEGYTGFSLSGAATQVQGTGSITATKITQNNVNPDASSRFDFNFAPTLNSSGNLFSNNTQGALFGSGANAGAFDSNYAASTPDFGAGDYRLFELDYSIVAPVTGSSVYDLSLKLGQQKFGVVGGSSSVGFGDPSDLVLVTGTGSTVGATGTTPDAVITVNTVATPEPASLAVLGVAGIGGLVSRRRRA
ncbi:MAG TPA: PEP-CTERM sorting domain-containing protein [Phycisphaerae bacterium]|nr:PEP-CTERM sorting domain-containing protein [Phycisphaerae bacterium]